MGRGGSANNSNFYTDYIFPTNMRMKNPGCTTTASHNLFVNKQYLSPDPIGLLGGVNPYAHVNNRLKFIDRLGLYKILSPDRDKSKCCKLMRGNISPKSWEKFPSIGRDSSFITDKEATLKYFSGVQNGEVTIPNH